MSENEERQDEISDATHETSDATHDVGDMRADFEAAIEMVETDESAEGSSETPADSEQAAVAVSSDASRGAPESDKDARKVQTEIETPQPKNPVKTERAPVNWDATSREHWDSLPDAVKTQVAERERNINMVLQQTAEERKIAKSFTDTMLKYQQPLQSLGFQDPYTAVDTVLNYAVQMRQGSTQDRANAAAKIIKDFGIDIDALDNALVGGGQAPVSGEAQHVEQLLDQRLAPVNQLIQEIQAAKNNQQAQQHQSVQQNVADFMNQQEFAEDVRMDMADLLDLAAARGEQMTLEQAYDRACRMNPQVSQVLLDRERQAQTQQAKQQIQEKRNAASSVVGNPHGAGAQRKPQTLEDAINDAWDLHMRS